MLDVTLRKYNITDRAKSLDLVQSVRFGSQADLFPNITSTAASERKAVVREWVFRGQILNVRSHQKRSFTSRVYRSFEGQLSANSGR
jgi:hypothetical protein